MKFAERLDRFLKYFPVLRTSRALRQFVIFCGVGATNTAWDLGIYLLLTEGPIPFHLTPLAANPIGFVISVINSYVLNQALTFHDVEKEHSRQIPRFLLINLVTLGVYESLLWIGIHALHMHHIAVKLIAILLVTMWSFTANRLWTFRQQSAT